VWSCLGGRPLLPEYRSQAEEENDKMKVQLCREQTASAELQARLEAEKDGNYQLAGERVLYSNVY